jgi:hypothetical protein
VSLYWLSYRVNGRPRVVVQPATSIIHARLKAAIADLADDQNFAEGHELDPKTAGKVPGEAISRRLSQDEAAELLDHLAA